MPEKVSTSDNGNFETLWEVEIDGTIRYNTPNITIKEKEARKWYFIEVFLPEDHCINVKENEKIDKNWLGLAEKAWTKHYLKSSFKIIIQYHTSCCWNNRHDTKTTWNL